MISDQRWKEAVEVLKRRYQNSACLPLILSILHTFEDINERKYRTDLEMFLHESKLEDFYNEEQGIVTISTMHKSKGREYDNVYMMIGHADMASDEEKRKLYVAMTRAKKRLHLHYFGNSFDQFGSYASDVKNDEQIYSQPEELILQLSHKDVYLDFFKGKTDLIFRQMHLKSGDHLAVDNYRLYGQVDKKVIPVLQFSAKCNKDINALMMSGYYPYDAVIRFICAWKGKEDTEETAVILADIFLHKKQAKEDKYTEAQEARFT